MQRSLVNEASLVMDCVFKELGGSSRGAIWREGIDAVSEMKQADFNRWCEMEWPGYYVKYLVMRECHSNGVLQTFKPLEEMKHYMVKGNYLWEFRVNNVEMESIILADQARTDNLIKEHGGIGTILFEAVYEWDKDGSFNRWHQNECGGPSQYVRDRIARGASARPRKKTFSLVDAIVFYFDSRLIREAINQGWLSLGATSMRNQDGSPRNPKYILHLSEKLASGDTDGIIGVRNFGADLVEFNKAFQGYNMI